MAWACSGKRPQTSDRICECWQARCPRARNTPLPASRLQVENSGFGDILRKLCAPYDETFGRSGRPGIDLAVYLKVQMVGVSKVISGERGARTRF